MNYIALDISEINMYGHGVSCSIEYMDMCVETLVSHAEDISIGSGRT